MKNKNLIIWGIVVFLILLFVLLYNSLVKKEQKVIAQWANVENAYQRRIDLLGNLVNTVKGYAKHENKTLTEVVEARAKATSVTIDPSKLDATSIQKFEQSQNEIKSAFSKLMVVVEQYPDLKANQNFLELQSQIEGTENRINVQRNLYNEKANEYNTSIKTFPGVLFAKLFGFKEKLYFKSQSEAAKAPKVEF